MPEEPEANETPSQGSSLALRLEADAIRLVASIGDLPEPPRLWARWSSSWSPMIASIRSSTLTLRSKG